MKQFFRHGLILFGFGAAALTLMAGDSKAHDAAVAKTRQDAIAKIEKDDIEGATALVGDHGTSEKGTLVWYQQSAFELLTHAQILRANLDYEGTHRAARAAIKLLAHALKSKGEVAGAGSRAGLQLQMAQIYEDLLGDTASARQAYQKALRETPDDVTAKQALARYAEEDSKFERIKSRK